MPRHRIMPSPHLDDGGIGSLWVRRCQQSAIVIHTDQQPDDVNDFPDDPARPSIPRERGRARAEENHRSDDR